MARIRYIKPGFFQDEELCELSPWHRLCYAGLWGQADKAGRMAYRPRYLQVQIFPYDRDVEIVPLIDDLVKNGFMLKYTVGARTYLAVQPEAWKKHQRPRKDEPESELPPPPATGVPAPTLVPPPSGTAPTSPMLPTALSTVAGSSLHSDGPASAEWIGKGEGDRKGDRNGEGAPAAPAPAPVAPPVQRVATGPHRTHAHCGPVCVPAFIHDDFIKQLRGDEDEADRRLREWYRQVDAVWAERPVGDKPETFWWARFREWVGTTVDARAAPPIAPSAPDLPPVWAAILERLEIGLNKRVVNEHFRPLVVLQDTGDVLLLGAPNKAAVTFIERHFRTHLAAAIEKVRAGLEVRVVVAADKRGAA